MDRAETFCTKIVQMLSTRGTRDKVYDQVIKNSKA